MPSILTDQDTDWKPRSKAIYNWKEWFDGVPREFQQGVDFTCAPTTFRNSALKAAIRMDMNIRTKLMGDKVRVQRIG